MFNVETLVRPNIQNLQPYSSARSEYEGTAEVFLDANENPFGFLNRYPDPQQQALKNKLVTMKGLNSNSIFIGNGSDEVVDLAFRIFCEPGKDKALCFSPTYGMYAVSAAIQGVTLMDLPLRTDFQIDTTKLKPYLDDKQLKLIFICSPNNPTGNTINQEDIIQILTQFSGIVLLDEAYIDFSTDRSWLSVLSQYPNLIISQTLSKAWGLAGARIGIAYADESIIRIFNRVKPPYNVSTPNQLAALKVLENETSFIKQKEIILKEKAKLQTVLNDLAIVDRVYPSNTNFLLVAFADAKACYEALKAKGIITRNRHRLVANCLRITIGTPAENEKLLTTLLEQQEDLLKN
ncbi:MAG: histidinol-phosphate transaminase [Saprospiraceae bacterium]